VHYGDITTLQVDAIVNAANSTLSGGGGVDAVIHNAAGPELLEKCRQIGGCPTGEARITKGYNLEAKYIIHTVGPVFSDSQNRDSLLSAAYRNSLKLAIENKVNTIAFPNISTGVYRYPKPLAAKIAIEAVVNFLQNDNNIEKVIFCCFDSDNFDIYKKILDTID